MPRAQISFEYIIVVAVAIGLLIPGVFFFYSYNQSSVGNTINSRLNEIGLRMLSTAQSTYALGNGAWQTMEFTMPQGVTNLTLGTGGMVDHREIVFTYDTSTGPAQAVFFSPVNLTTGLADGRFGDYAPDGFPSGVVQYRFVAQGGQVNIIDVTNVTGVA